MKLGPILLVNLLLIGASIYAYDSWRTPAQSRAAEPAFDYDAYDDLRADAPVEPRDPFADGALLEVDGGAGGARSRELLARVESLEGDLARLRRQMASGGAGGNGSTGSGLPSVDLGDVGDLAGSSFDDGKIAAFEIYMDEVHRRKAVARQRGVIAGQLKRLKLGLTEREQAAVLEETLAYHERLSTLYKGGWPKDEDGRQRRRDDFAKLHRAFQANLQELVPAGAAEKITQGRMGRNRGFMRSLQADDR